MTQNGNRSKYKLLDCDVGATIPRRGPYREEWIRAPISEVPISISFREGTYSTDEKLPEEELKIMKGQVEKRKSFFDAQPLSSPQQNEADRPRPQKDNPVKIINYRPKKFYPKVAPRRKTLEGKDINLSSRDDSNVRCQINNNSPAESQGVSSTGRDKNSRNRRYTDFITPPVWKAVQIYEAEKLKQEYDERQKQKELECQNFDNRAKGASGLKTETEFRTRRHNAFPGANTPGKHVPEISCRSDAAVKRRVRSAGNTFDSSCENSVVYRRTVASDAGGMCDVVEKTFSMPRVIAASVKSFKDIPEDLFDSLPESSVDPSPEELQNNNHHSEWKNMREGRRALFGSIAGNSSADDHHIEQLSSQDNTRCSYLSNHEGRKALRKVGDETDMGSVYLESSANRRKLRGCCSSAIEGSDRVTLSLPPPKLIKRGEFPPSDTERREVSKKDYICQLERDLQQAGIYFRKPEATTTSAPGHISDGNASEGEIHHALATLDASFEGFCSDSSSESSCATRSQTSSVVESERDPQAPQFLDSGRDKSVQTKPLRSEAHISKCYVKSAAKNVTSHGNHKESLENADGGISVKQISGNKTVITVGRTCDEVPKTVSANDSATLNDAAMENYNLIEEVYVTSKTKPKPVPQTTVEMKAYYPSVNFSKGASTSVHMDSDSGHESGATSPCGTLTGEDTTSPPPSPPTPKISQSFLSYENYLRKQSRSNAGDNRENLSSESTRHEMTPQSENNAGAKEAPHLEPVSVAVVSDIRDDYVVIPRTSQATESVHYVVVAIDFGTTYSGYAFSFTNDPENVHMMKKWEGGDPGIQNQKTPTVVLLTPDEGFHSLGFNARDTYHDLDPTEAQNWYFFDRFKMELHSDQPLTRDTLLEAKNGKKIPALNIFSFALQYFRDHALRELSEQTGVDVEEDDVRWVITVPAIWSHPAKQFMRTAAYQASMGSPSRPDQLLIALEPEAAAIYCRRLRQNQLIHERTLEILSKRPALTSSAPSTLKGLKKGASQSDILSLPELDKEELVSLPIMNQEQVEDWLREGTVYMVVDCGGGTVDITVHQMTDRKSGHLKELHKATGGPYGSTGVDREFEKLLDMIFGAQFMRLFRSQRSAAYVELMIAFEARKRNSSPNKSSPLNIALPFAFIDFFKKTKSKEVEYAIRKHSDLGVKWSSQGMLRIEPDTMKQLFEPTLNKISQAIDAVLSAPEMADLQYMFLVGGFAESEILQKHIRDSFSNRVSVIIPQGMGLAILRGAVQFGLDPSVVTVRRSRLTYGVGVLNRYDESVHPPEKKVVASGCIWCADILDKFVHIDQSVAVGDIVTRSYTPATPTQKSVILHLYATEEDDVKYVTDKGVRRVGTLQLELGEPTPKTTQTTKTEERGTTSVNTEDNKKLSRREITVHLKFGGTEVKASAVDHLTGQCVKANIEFLAL